MIDEGDKAPLFTLLSDTGKVSLKSLLGKNVVVYFYPKDMTPGCTQQACDFKDQFAKLKKAGAVVLGISRDSVDRHEAFREKYGLPFALLSDEDGSICEAYGVWKKKSLYGRSFMGIERTTFVINPKGKVAKVFRKVKVKGHVAEVLDTLAEIK